MEDASLVFDGVCNINIDTLVIDNAFSNMTTLGVKIIGKNCNDNNNNVCNFSRNYRNFLFFYAFYMEDIESGCVFYINTKKNIQFDNSLFQVNKY